MPVDPTDIELTPLQKQRLAAKADQSGVDYATLVDEWLGLQTPEVESVNGQEPKEPKNMLEALESIGAIGCFEGPGDLSTNPKYMEGFGINASRRRDSD